MNFNIKPEPIAEISEKSVVEQNSEKNLLDVSLNKDIESSSDDELNSSMTTFKMKKNFKKSKFSEQSKNFQEEVKLIKVID